LDIMPKTISVPTRCTLCPRRCGADRAAGRTGFCRAGATLKAARAALDMSQAELAKRVNVSRQTIVAIEKGDYNPTIKLCIAICHELGKTLDELFWEW
jgi:putative transcriptional regulator